MKSRRSSGRNGVREPILTTAISPLADEPVRASGAMSPSAPLTLAGRRGAVPSQTSCLLGVSPAVDRRDSEHLIRLWSTALLRCPVNDGRRRLLVDIGPRLAHPAPLSPGCQSRAKRPRQGLQPVFTYAAAGHRTGPGKPRSKMLHAGGGDTDRLRIVPHLSLTCNAEAYRSLSRPSRASSETRSGFKSQASTRAKLSSAGPTRPASQPASWRRSSPGICPESATSSTTTLAHSCPS